MLHGVRNTPRKPSPHETITEKTPRALFTTPEHRYVGNHIHLTWPDPSLPTGSVTLPASSDATTFDLQSLDPTLNPLRLKYGQITSLAGDFYGTYLPISEGPTLESRIDRFTSSWNLLVRERPSVAELRNILAIENAFELDPLRSAPEDTPPSAVYASMSDLVMTKAWFIATRNRTPAHGYTTTYPGYLGLVLTNFDHFGAAAHLAYAAGHTAALRLAARGTTPSDLKLAYAMNAFADHFLEDAFSAGHLRVPRRALHDHNLDVRRVGLSTLAHLPVADLCANLMHDEDGALGLDVRNAAGDAWRCFGDDYLFDDCGAETLRLCVRAIQVSADEVHAAFVARVVPDAGSFGALRLVPTLESANGPQRLAPLFRVDGDGKVVRRGRNLRRGGIRRGDWTEYTERFWYATTWAACVASGAWEWPLTMEGGGVGVRERVEGGEDDDGFVIV